MSTGLAKKSHESSAQQTYELTPVLSEQWQLSWTCSAMFGWFAIVFALINHTPLSLEHTWQHTNAGHWIMRHGELPTEITSVPLAQGMPHVAESWLFDSCVFMLASRFGPEAISASIALSTSIALWLWCGLIYRVSQSTVFTLASSVILAFSWSSGFASLQPRLFAATLMVAVLWLVLPSRPFGNLWDDVVEDQEGNEPSNERILSSWRWLSIFLLFVFWANVDNSFWTGILLLLAIAIGHAITAVVKQGLSGLLADNVRCWFWLTQLALIGTLLTPQHLRLWENAATSGLDRFLSGVYSGRGLYLPSLAGVTAVGLVATLLFRARRSKQTLSGAEYVVPIFFVALAAVSSRHLFWLAPILLFIAARHTTPSKLSTTSPKQTSASESANASLRFAAMLFSLLFLWCGFALSPISAPLLSGKERAKEYLFATSVPTEVSAFLRDQPSASSSEFGWTSVDRPLIFAPADWSDWLLWDGTSDVRVFANSQIRSLPRNVRADYAKTFRGEPGWDRVLDRYAVGTLVVDKLRQPRLASEVMRHSAWKLLLETPGSLTLGRAQSSRRKS